MQLIHEAPMVTKLHIIKEKINHTMPPMRQASAAGTAGGEGVQETHHF